MRRKKFAAILLMVVLAVSSFVLPAGAVLNEGGAPAICATGQFNMDIPGETLFKASTSFPLEVGETVTIKASYSPFSANVDFGLITPDGYFYCFTVTNGSIDKTIKITERGNYTFAIQNNSSAAISVSGYVNY